MSKKRVTLSDRVREAIKASPISRNAICREVGIDKGALSRFMAGKVGMELSSFEALAAFLGLDMVARGTPAGGTKPKTRKAVGSKEGA